MASVATADLYSVLGVRPSADTAEIGAAFRARAKQLHPDLVDGDAERFKDLSRAYRVLGDPDRRRTYDAARRPVRAPGARPGPRSPGPTPRPAPPILASPARARAALWCGLVLVVLGVALAAVVPLLGDATRGSTLGRDITLWISAVKLVAGGAVLAVVGRRRLERFVRQSAPGNR